MSEKHDAASMRDAPWDACLSWGGVVHSLDGTDTTVPKSADAVAEVLYYGEHGIDDWDGSEAAVVRLHDGRLMAWETWWGPTGSGFCADAYGGDAEVWFARPENLQDLILQALSDSSRELAGIPREGLK